jgi:hypothetical protein
MDYKTFPVQHNIHFVRHSIHAVSKLKASVPLALTALMLAFASCNSQDDILPETLPSAAGSPVEVALTLSASQEILAGDNPLTRAVEDNASSPYATIKNLWVLQFNGTGDAARLTGVPAYYDGNPASCKLYPGAGQTVFFLANTFDTSLTWPVTLTLGELKTRCTNIGGGEASVHGQGNSTSTPEADYPDNADYYLLLNGLWQGDIATAGSLSATLHRNTARVDIHLKNNTIGTNTVTITSVQACCVMARQYLCTDYALPTVFPAGTPYLETADYVPVAWESGTVTDEGYTRFRFYLPANLRGTRTGISQKKDKSEYHPALATRIVVHGMYEDDGKTVPVTYTIYPGANLTTDFNLRPDHAYTCTLDINGHDATGVDRRVRNYGLRNFAVPGEERANCYILNPNPAGTRQFRIPVDRINVFWGNQGYQNVPANTLGGSDTWTAEILWCDFERSSNPADPNYFALFKASGTGADGATDGYFTAECGPRADGNVLVAVKEGNTILWSWHLWLTDYDPYVASIPSTGPGTDAQTAITDVPGGLVISAVNNKAANGKYMLHMDRCLGQSKARPDAQPLYQWGRKDPFAYSQADGAQLFTDNLSASTSRLNATLNPTMRYDDAGGNTADWLGSADAHNNNAWDDPTITTPVEFQAKSLYDPCPPGWMIPRSRTNFARGWATSSGIYRLFNIQGVRWTWVYQDFCWLSQRTGNRDDVMYNANNLGNYYDAVAGKTRAKLFGVIPERMQY